MTTTAKKLDSHRQEAQAEDVAFLMSTGVPRDVACARVGVSWDTIEKRVARAAGTAA